MNTLSKKTKTISKKALILTTVMIFASGCSMAYQKKDEQSITVSDIYRFSPVDAQPIAEEHCAQYDKVPELADENGWHAWFFAFNRKIYECVEK